MKKTKILCTIIFLCLGLVACTGRNEADDPEPDIDVNRMIVRKDVENLVEVCIEDGEATVTLDVGRFEELYDFSQQYEMEMYSGTIRIVGNSSKIRDACIAQISELDHMNGADFVTPTIFLLMEDGTVEHVMVDFYPVDSKDPEFQSEQLLWMKDIVSLSYESDGEGFGSMTVYAEDKNGLRYDLRIPASFCQLYSGAWVCEIHDVEDDVQAGHYGVLTFDVDGTVVFENGWIGYGTPTVYRGSYDLTLAENDETRPGMLTLDLHMDSTSYNTEEPKKIQGTFFAEITNLVALNLWRSEGDSLHLNENSDLIPEEFWLGYHPFSEDNPSYLYDSTPTFDDYIDYLLSTLVEAKNLVEVDGMEVLDTEEYIDIDGGYERIICIGTNHSGHFVREIYYAISSDGVIYEYDAVLDEWIVEWVPD